MIISDLLSEEGGDGRREEECVCDRGIRWSRHDGGHVGRSGGDEEEVQQISSTSGNVLFPATVMWLYALLHNNFIFYTPHKHFQTTGLEHSFIKDMTFSFIRHLCKICLQDLSARFVCKICLQDLSARQANILFLSANQILFNQHLLASLGSNNQDWEDERGGCSARIIYIGW